MVQDSTKTCIKPWNFGGSVSQLRKRHKALLFKVNNLN